MTAKNRKLLTACFSLLLVLVVLFASTITASAYTYSQYPITLAFGNLENAPYESIYVQTYNGGLDEMGTITVTQPLTDANHNIAVAEFFTRDGQQYCLMDGLEVPIDYQIGIPNGLYYVCATAVVVSGEHSFFGGVGLSTGTAGGLLAEQGLFLHFELNTGNVFTLINGTYHTGAYEHMTVILTPIDSGGNTPTECPSLEEQIANYNGTWTEFLMMLRQNNRTLANSYQNNIDLAIQSGFQNGKEIGFEQGFEQGFDEGHLEGYTEGFNAGLNGGANRDPIDQYWNSTKDYILIAGQPYFAPNGFGSIDQYNTVGIYGEHESKLHRADGTIRSFNGQYVTQFASTGTLGGGWYKIGATVGDANAYEQSITVETNDKAYYVSRVSPLGDPTEEFLVAIWVDGYDAWYVAEEYAHSGTVAHNNKSYKQVYSIYMTDIRPTAQRFVNYDNPTLHETFNEDINATLYLATFNQLNNYNVYTDDIGIVESYNNGFDAGANTTLWTDLISQPIVAFFSIPLAQIIVEGVTYTLTYGIVLGAGIVGLIVIWFLKLFAGG